MGRRLGRLSFERALCLDSSCLTREQRFPQLRLIRFADLCHADSSETLGYCLRRGKEESNEAQLRIRHDISLSTHFIRKATFLLTPASSARILAKEVDTREDASRAPGCKWSRERLGPNEFILS